MIATMPNHPTCSFWDRIAPKYARKPVSDPLAYEQKLAALEAHLGPNDTVLEIGCGTGSTALRLADRVSRYTASDISKGMIEIAQAKRDASSKSNVTFYHADALQEFEGEPFDVVCAFSLLHLVDDIPALLRHVHGQLKPGGLFISKTVCTKDGNFLIPAFITLLRAVGYAPNVTFLSTEELTAQIFDAGFEIEDISFFGSNRMNPFIVARRPLA